jgi:hypothetical protein
MKSYMAQPLSIYYPNLSCCWLVYWTRLKGLSALGSHSLTVGVRANLGPTRRASLYIPTACHCSLRKPPPLAGIQSLEWDERAASNLSPLTLDDIRLVGVLLGVCHGGSCPHVSPMNGTCSARPGTLYPERNALAYALQDHFPSRTGSGKEENWYNFLPYIQICNPMLNIKAGLDKHPACWAGYQHTLSSSTANMLVCKLVMGLGCSGGLLRVGFAMDLYGLL